ncbi:MAG: transporter substrate-binding domain-containing protein, partial [Clostridia bacterium]|nr:transporter substrate-binding domain-containing protein [Clostridia bacterium]
AWQMSEGNIDIAIMSLEKLSGKNYLSTETPFYLDPCVLMGYTVPDQTALGGKRIAVLHDTAACDVLSKYQQDEENALIIVTYAAYYDMLVALRAGSVDAVCMPRSVALTHREKAMVLSNYALGTVDYHVIGTSEEKDLISLIDSQLIRWANDGTLRSWYEAYDLLYDLG